MQFGRISSRAILTVIIAFYTMYAAGPFVWVATMSVRTTTEISEEHYAWPSIFHWDQFSRAWVDSNYSLYFQNSAMVVVIAVLVLTVFGSMAAHCLARYRFRGNRVVYFLLFSSIIFPPQVTLISLFQILTDYGLFNTLTGLTLAYISLQLPLTIYILEGFFSQIPQDLFDAAKIDGYSDVEIFWRLVLPVGVPAIATTVILNFIMLWNEFMYAVVLISDESKRTLPLGIQQFVGDHYQDVGMVAAGMMISILPVILLYVFFSEKLIKGMTAGAMK